MPKPPEKGVGMYRGGFTSATLKTALREVRCGGQELGLRLEVGAGSWLAAWQVVGGVVKCSVPDAAGTAIMLTLGLFFFN